MHITNREETYLKEIAILAIKNSIRSEDKNEKMDNMYISNNMLAETLKTTPAAVTEMLIKISEKKLIEYLKYRGVKLTNEGKKIAYYALRKQRIWQSFLYTKLKMKLDEIKLISQELTKITNENLINRLDEFLNNPTYSPYGEPIPDINGLLKSKNSIYLDKIEEGAKVFITAIAENDNPYLLQYISKKGIYIGTQIILVEKLDFDNSLDIIIDGNQKCNISQKVAQNILVTR